MDARRTLALSVNARHPYRLDDDDVHARGLSVQHGRRSIVRFDGRADRVFRNFLRCHQRRGVRASARLRGETLGPIRRRRGPRHASRRSFGIVALFPFVPSATHGSSHQIVRRRPQQLRQQSQCRSPLFADRARGKEPAQSMARFVRRACQPRFGGRHHPRGDNAFLALCVPDERRRGRAPRSVDCLGASDAPGVHQDLPRLVVETRHQRLCLSASRPGEPFAIPSSAHRRRRAGGRLRARARSRDRRPQDSRARQPPHLTRRRGGQEGGASLSPWLVPAADSRRLPASCSRRRPGGGGRGPRVVDDGCARRRLRSASDDRGRR